MNSKEFVAPNIQGPVLVHSDMLRVLRLVTRTKDRAQMMQRHLDLLKSNLGPRELWMPAFDYGFCQTGVYDIAVSDSRVGPLTNYFGSQKGVWRTEVPVFSCFGQGLAPKVNHGVVIDPFDEQSIFAELVRRDGAILFYGAALHSVTFIHYVERAAGGPVYRYDKNFHGSVVDRDGSSRPIDLRYHVRPMGLDFDYDWDKLERDLIDGGLIFRPGAKNVFSVGAAALKKFWLEKLFADPLYLLCPSTLEWVSNKLEELGRPFVLADFE